MARPKRTPRAPIRARRSTRQRLFELEGRNLEKDSRNKELRLLEAGTFTDVIVNCGDNTFNLHKFVLCTRSEYFHRALTGPFAEATSGTIILDETDPEIFGAVVEYLYRQEVANLNLLKTRIDVVGTLTQLYKSGQYFAVDGLENDVISCLRMGYYSSLGVSTDCKTMPVAASNQDTEWLAHLFVAIDMAFEEGVIRDDPLQKFFTNLVHRSFDWCFQSFEFKKNLETRGCFAIAITNDVVEHIADLGLKPLTSLGGNECQGLNCCNCQASLEDERAVLIGVPSAQRRTEGQRPQYVCLLCKNKRARDQF